MPLQHAAEVERSWLRMVLSAQGRAPWPTVSGVFGEFHVDDADVDQAFTAWREACEDSRAVATPSSPSMTWWTSGARPSRSATS
ncbi:mycothiol transferase [Streptomyces sp. 3N207]|uniref:mycothiol transferase n=1 Tax=Streptomyces sp. 3N207 TaxID=3457417 RepID=UPI003FCF8082